MKRVVANPAFMGAHYAQVAQQLAPLLSYNENELALKLRPTVVRTNENGSAVTNQYVDLKRKLTFEQWQQLTQAMTGLKFGADESQTLNAGKEFLQGAPATGDFRSRGPATALPKQETLQRMWLVLPRTVRRTSMEPC